MAGRVYTHKQLDERLDQAARVPELFEAEARKLATELDAKNLNLEITDPLTWRRKPEVTGDPNRVSVQGQFRSDVDSILLLDRETEARLARRIEFARIRLERVLEAAGLTPEDLRGNVSSTPSMYLQSGRVDCNLPPKICRRWMEWHALRTEMVERNLYLVLINVERYSHTSASRFDLIQEGSGALFRAVDGFDWRRGLLFRTYAVHWLNQAFRSYLYNFNSTVRVPVYLQKAMKHINAAIERLGDKNASVEAIAEEAKLGPNLVAAALASSRSTHSIDMPLGGEEGATLSEILNGPDEGTGGYTPELEDISLEQGISQALDRLSERERFVVSMRFGIGTEREHTLAEVAAQLGVSLERVRQIQVRAISKMRSPSLRKAVSPFL